MNITTIFTIKNVMNLQLAIFAIITFLTNHSFPIFSTDWTNNYHILKICFYLLKYAYLPESCLATTPWGVHWFRISFLRCPADCTLSFTNFKSTKFATHLRCCLYDAVFNTKIVCVFPACLDGNGVSEVLIFEKASIFPSM